MKGPSERGLTAQRLRDVRLQAGYTNQKAAAAHVREVTGVIGLTDSQWASYESGDARRPFQQKHRDAIEAVFGPLGDQPAPEPAAASADLAALLAAMTDQTRAMTALVERVADDERLDRLERQMERLAEAVTTIAKKLASWEESGGAPGSPSEVPPGQRRRGAGPKSHASPR